MPLVSHHLHIPTVDNQGNSLAHLLPAVNRELAKHGVPGSSVVPVMGTWTDPDTGQSYPDEAMHRIEADVEDTPEMDDLFSRMSEAVAHAGGQVGVYHRKIPVQTTIHDPRPHEDIDLSAPESQGGWGNPYEQQVPAAEDQSAYTASIFS